MNKLAASDVPGADAAMVIFGGRGRQLILMLAMVTAISALNATLLLAPRILFGMARDGFLPSWVASVNSGGTPSAGLLLVAPGSIALVLSGGYEKLIALSSFLVVSLYLSGFCALFGLRVREPDLPRPFKAWGLSVDEFGCPACIVCIPCRDHRGRPQGRSFHTDPDRAQLPRLPFRSKSSGKHQRYHHGSARVAGCSDVVTDANRLLRQYETGWKDSAGGFR
jgi:hypothetical protein